MPPTFSTWPASVAPVMLSRRTKPAAMPAPASPPSPTARPTARMERLVGLILSPSDLESAAERAFSSSSGVDSPELEIASTDTFPLLALILPVEEASTLLRSFAIAMLMPPPTVPPAPTDAPYRSARVFCSALTLTLPVMSAVSLMRAMTASFGLSE